MIDRLLNPIKNKSFFLFGARGVGKSTLISEKYAEDAYLVINLLKDEEYYSLSQRPDSLIERVKNAPVGSLIVLDEVQRVPKLLNTVHYLIEDKKLRFILSGSSSRKLKRGSANMLAGRALYYELFPFTHTELNKDFNLQTTLNWGSLPQISTLNEKQDRIEYLQSYVDIYIKEEVVAEQLVRQLPPFRKFLDVAAQMNCKIINYSKIAREVGTTNDTIKQYFSILEETHLGIMLPAYHTSIRKQQTLAPKFYFFDCGVPRAILRTNEAPLNESTSLYGDCFEQFVILELYRLNSYLKKRATFSYLKTKDGAEIDLIIELPNKKPILVEIKSSLNISPEQLRNLRVFSKDMQNSGAYCLSRDPIKKQIDSISVLPWDEGIKEILA